MARNRKRRDPVPIEFKTVGDLQDFWDTHSIADYDDLFEDVKFDVDIHRRSNYIAVEPTLMKELAKRARTMGISTETLVNLLLTRQLSKAVSHEKDISDRITTNPKIAGGKPTVKGKRITVGAILKLIEDGLTFDQIKRDYFPNLTEEDIQASLEFAKALVEGPHEEFAEER